MQREIRDREIKKMLLKDLEKTNNDISQKVCEWLWEDFGIKVHCNWKELEKRILKEKTITASDLAVFMIGEGIQVNEDYWLSNWHL